MKVTKVYCVADFVRNFDHKVFIFLCTSVKWNVSNKKWSQGMLGKIVFWQ